MRPRCFFVVVICALCAVPLHAQSASPSLRFPVIVYSAAMSGDWTSTMLCTGCQEDNPAFRWASDRRPLLYTVGAVSDVAALWLFTRFVGKKHPREARVLLYVAATMRVALIAHNLREQ